MTNPRLAFLFVAPALIFLAAVLGWPLLQAVILSFQNVGVIGSAGAWVGFDNYAAVLGGSGFWSAFGRSVVWVVGNAVVQTTLALGVALILNQKFPGVRIARTWIILAWIVPTVVSNVSLTSPRAASREKNSSRSIAIVAAAITPCPLMAG